MILEFANMLLPTFEKHKYLLNLNKSSITAVRELMNLYLNTNRKEIGWNELCISLEYLINALCTLYGRKVVLLIDEYDRTITNLYAAESPLYKDAIDLTKGILDPIKNNKKLLLTVFAGATRLAKADIFTGIDNFYHDSVLESSFSEFFGFTEDDVSLLIGKLILLKPTLSEKEVKNSITKWYNGYNIGNQTIYNPWSIMHCLFALSENLDVPYSNYWIQTSSTTFIEEAVIKIPTTKKIEELIIDRQTGFVYEESFIFEGINTSEKSLLSFLFNSGYITRLGSNAYKIPNNEIYSHLFKHILPLIEEKNYRNVLLTSFGDTGAYGKAFQETVLDKMDCSYCYESYFQYMILSPFNRQNKIEALYELYMEKQAVDSKKIGVFLTPIKEKLSSVFILELKNVSNCGSIKKMTTNVLSQFFSKGCIDFALEEAELESNKHWEFFHIRAIVFSPNKFKKKWIITIKEFKLNKEGLQSTLKTIKKKNYKKKAMIELLTHHSISISEYPSQT